MKAFLSFSDVAYPGLVVREWVKPARASRLVFSDPSEKLFFLEPLAQQ